MEQIKAPFTDEQVKGLNEYQNSGVFHEFTCGNSKHPADKGRTLVAYNEGWKCPNCDYTQNWAFASMTDGKMIEAGKKWLSDKIKT